MIPESDKNLLRQIRLASIVIAIGFLGYGLFNPFAYFFVGPVVIISIGVWMLTSIIIERQKNRKKLR